MAAAFGVVLDIHSTLSDEDESDDGEMPGVSDDDECDSSEQGATAGDAFCLSAIGDDADDDGNDFTEVGALCVSTTGGDSTATSVSTGTFAFVTTPSSSDSATGAFFASGAVALENTARRVLTGELVAGDAGVSLAILAALEFTVTITAVVLYPVGTEVLVASDFHDLPRFEIGCWLPPPPLTSPVFCPLLAPPCFVLVIEPPDWLIWTFVSWWTLLSEGCLDKAAFDDAR